METEKRPENLPTIKKEIETIREGELKFNMKHTKEMPDFEKVEAVVKLNSAAVLREAHHLKKQEEE